MRANFDKLSEVGLAHLVEVVEEPEYSMGKIREHEVKYGISNQEFLRRFQDGYGTSGISLDDFYDWNFANAMVEQVRGGVLL